MSATGVESSVANSTRNFINITTSYKVPFINLTATQAAPIIAAAATATNFQPTAVHAISTSAGASPPPPSPAAAAAPPPANASGASVFQQRVSQPPMATAAPPRQLTTIPIQPSRTAATIITNNKRPTVIIYPTVSPESIVIPIVSCILGFPLLALLVICCLRRRAKLARERDRRRNYDMQDHAVSLVRFSPIHRLNNRSSRAISLRPERSLSRGFPSLELDTVIEERSDPEQTQTDIVSPESPLDPQKFRDFNSS